MFWKPVIRIFPGNDTPAAGILFFLSLRPSFSFSTNILFIVFCFESCSANFKYGCTAAGIFTGMMPIHRIAGVWITICLTGTGPFPLGMISSVCSLFSRPFARVIRVMSAGSVTSGGSYVSTNSGTTLQVIP